MHWMWALHPHEREAQSLSHDWNPLVIDRADFPLQGAGDVINVRWASDDPNPKHIELTRRKTQEQVKDALEKNGYGTTTEEFDYPINYQVAGLWPRGLCGCCSTTITAAAAVQRPSGARLVGQQHMLPHMLPHYHHMMTMTVAPQS